MTLSVLQDYRVGDFAGILGVVVSLLGFWITWVGVRKTRNAAEEAKRAADNTRNSLLAFEAVVDFSAAIALLEEIKRAHRYQQWVIVPDRYAALRKILIGVRETHSGLQPEQRKAVQEAITALTSMENSVEKSLPGGPSNGAAKLNAILSAQIDSFSALLSQLKARVGDK